MEDPVRIAAFDFDDTLVGCNSQSAFVRFLTERRLAPASLLLEVGFWFALNRARVPLNVAKIHARLISRLSGIPQDSLRKALQEFTESELRPRIRKDGEDWIARTRREGCHVLLLSAALEPMIALIAPSTGVDGYVATRVDVDPRGRLRVVGDMVYGEAKLGALREYADARFSSWRLEYAFGNDYADRFLLSEAARAVVVCPSPQLRALAEQQGWVVEDWR